jgi:predicted enzyme related to lactoylglutathione lyase
MAEGDRYIPGVPCWVDTTQPDVDKAGEFYGAIFGWELEDLMPPGSGTRYLEARIGGKRVAAISAGDPQNPPTEATWNMYVWVDDVEATAAKVEAAGGKVVTPPMEVMDAGWMATFTDREGASFGVWQPKEHRGAEVVNEHGSVNFNDLNTRDPEAAKEFYGEVFGWKALTMEGGFEMWTLPGYGDFLEQINPGTKENMADMGAPEGFIDVVASLQQIPDDQPDTPAHWSVTFAVDDADAAAETAAANGGTVDMPPTDMPWVRVTWITDPGGVAFSASQFVPPENAGD